MENAGSPVAGATGRIDLKMNLQSWINKQAVGAGIRAAAAHFFRQNRSTELHCSRRPMKSLSARVQKLTVCLGWVLTLVMVSSAPAQVNYYTTNGTEYSVIGSLPGDQVNPDVAVSTNGGFVVWQDNVTDGDSWGISARRLDTTLSGTLGTFRVNVTGAGSQENPRVVMLKNNGAVFVWQGGTPGLNQHIYTRFLTASNTFLTTNDILVNTFTNNFQVTPAVAVLNNSNVVVVWSSYNQAKTNSMLDVFAQILSPSGQKVGTNFLVNQFTSYNQHTPTIAALSGGGFVVAWVSEQERQVYAVSSTSNTAAALQAANTPSVDIYARVFNASGTATNNEFRINTDNNPCANPSIAAAMDGSFLITWTARNMANLNNGLDIYGRTFTNAISGGPVPSSPVFGINTYLYGDQYAPRVCALGLDYLVTWTSLNQDGSGEGVYGQFVHSNGSLTGGEFRVNTTTAGDQMQPAVASDGVSQFLTVWTSFTGAPNNFDLFAQRFINSALMLETMSAPYVWVPFTVVSNKYQPQLVVSWPPLLGLSVSNYEVYVDGAASPTGVLVTNQWTMTAANGLTTNNSHSFQVDYVLINGQRSPISPATSGTTWSGLNWGGVPYEWMAKYYGGYNTNTGQYTTTNWPSASGRLATGGLTLAQVFVGGGNPLKSSTWLQTQLTRTAQGIFLSWNTQPGATYQVQVTTNFISWSNLGSPRYAAGTMDSIDVGASAAGYYRVVILR